MLKGAGQGPERSVGTADELAAELRRFLAGEPIASGRDAAGAPGQGRGGIHAVRRVHAGTGEGVPRRAGGTAVWQWRAAEKAREREALARSSAEMAQAEAVQARDAAKSAQAEAERQRDRADDARSVADKARVAEENARAEAERQRERFERFDYGRTVEVAHQEWRENNVPAALALLESTRAELRGWEWRYVHRLCHSELLTLKGHTAEVASASFSPDYRGSSPEFDRTAKVWDAEEES